MTGTMAKKQHRTPVPGPPFIRLLAALADRNAPRTGPDLSDRLSQWIDWTRAVALSRALDGRLPAPAGSEPTGVEALAEECAKVRASLVQSIQSTPDAGAPVRIDPIAFRQRCLTVQRAMLTATGRLRGQLRDRLSQEPGELPRLAEVDAAMEQALSPREQQLLASVPTLLGAHFERLRDDAGGDGADPDAGWLQIFRNDMQAVLMAELDVRFHPIEGLLAALRPH
ncbi:DUF3348 domain-containing protein [Stenotrophomonas sp. VV52]|uniref:DUF3348 domain-containing protein n=1 Tax=Stenotrophomonas sp. VV52 TaxID=2066958 RepID=UPI001558B14E|nr:DUF3348 domain-containing protein [Stenotrophomonas sp. VV52]